MHPIFTKRSVLSLRIPAQEPARWFAAVIGLLFLAAAGCGDDGPSRPKAVDPTVTAAAPDSGNVGTQVEITGADFQDGVRVAFGNHACLVVERISATTVRAYAPDSLVLGNVYDIRVANPGSATAELTAAYRVVAPELRVVNGVSRPSGNQGSPVILEGRSFGDLLGKGSVFFSDAGGQPIEAPVDLPENWTNEFIVATVPSGAESGPVWIETPTGITESIVFTVTQSATFSPSAIHWTSTAPLPEARQGMAASFVPVEDGSRAANLIYATGGADGDGVPATTVWVTETAASGELMPWSQALDLPDRVAFHRSVIATPFNALIDTTGAGHLYVIGGVDSSGTPTTAVYRAALGPDGWLSGWEATSPLPLPLHSMGAVVFRSWVYVAGGATEGNEPVATVYRAHIGFDGNLEPWESQESLPSPRAHAPLTQFAGNLYLVGGESSAVEPGSASSTGTRIASIVSHRLDLRTAELGSDPWAVNPSDLIKSVAKHSALIAGGTMLVSGGLYNGAGNSATEHQYAEINSDYTIGSFHGATGSQTIAGSSGAGGVPFYNHAAITYVDDAGEAHVIILGGADVNDPATVIGDTYYY